MKRWAALIIFVFTALNCESSGYRLIKVAKPDSFHSGGEIQVFINKAPKVKYKILGLAKVESPLEKERIELAKKAAREVGGNAVIGKSSKNQSQGDDDAGMQDFVVVSLGESNDPKISGDFKFDDPDNKDDPSIELSEARKREMKPTTEFKANDDGTVTDVKNNLLWEKCSYGQTLKGDLCEGQPKSINARQSFEYCESLKLLDKKWRVPTKEEITNSWKIEKEEKKFAQVNEIIEKYFKGTKSDVYWTSSTYKNDATAYWVVDMANGMVFAYGKGNTGYVRCVSGS